MCSRGRNWKEGCSIARAKKESDKDESSITWSDRGELFSNFHPSDSRWMREFLLCLGKKLLICSSAEDITHAWKNKHKQRQKRSRRKCIIFSSLYFLSLWFVKRRKEGRKIYDPRTNSTWVWLAIPPRFFSLPLQLKQEHYQHIYVCVYIDIYVCICSLAVHRLMERMYNEPRLLRLFLRITKEKKKWKAFFFVSVRDAESFTSSSLG